MFYKVSSETFSGHQNHYSTQKYLNCSFHRNLICEMITQQFCCNDCFGDRSHSNTTDLLGNNLSITETLPVLMYNLIHEKHYVNTEDSTQRNPAQCNTRLRHLWIFHPISDNPSFCLFTVIHELQLFPSALPHASGLLQCTVPCLLY